jgi:flavodoxin
LKIAIIYYSLSRHTLSLVKTLQASLTEASHSLTVTALEPSLLKIGEQRAELKSIPPVSGFDLLVLASPVHGGRASTPMQAFLDGCEPFNGKKVICLVTQVFPHWLGGDQALAAMLAQCRSKGARVVATGSVSWYSFARRRQVADILARVKSTF